MKHLKRGDSGPEVVALQKQLNAIGYNLKVFGFFGPQTEAAVKQIQLRTGLPNTGVYGPLTYAQLNYLLKTNPIEGIDVSVWNGRLDWQKLKYHGVQFAILKHSEGDNYKDPTFNFNLAECLKNEIPVGAYHFYRFWKDPKKQAQNLTSCGIDFTKPNTLPPVLDIEWQDNTGVSNSTIIKDRKSHEANLKLCLETIEKLCNRKPMIYTQASFWDGILGSPVGFEQYPLWVVDYNNSQAPVCPTNWAKWTLWQFSATGKRKGSNSLLDLNRFVGGKSDFNKLLNK